MVICRHCQAEQPEQTHLCGRCGQLLAEETHITPPSFVGADQLPFLTDNNGPGVADAPTQPFSMDNILPIASVLEAALQQDNYDNGQHGSHQQPQAQHGVHHQPQFVHGTHHQPQDFHGAHQQPQAAHGAHQQPQILHGAHHQPQAVHGMAQQPQAVHGAAHHARNLHGLKGCNPSCLVAAISTAAVLTVTTSLLLLFLYTSASPKGAQPTLNIPTSVNPGQGITVQGNHFSPDQHIWITLDTQQKAYIDESASLSQADLLEASQNLAQSQQGIPLTVKADGTFQTTVQSDPSWHMGSQHTIYISKQDGSLIVRRQFTVRTGSPTSNPTSSPTSNPTATPTSTPTPVSVSCNTGDTSTNITLGPVVAKQSTPISTVVKLCSQQGASWSAATTTDDGANWLSVNPSNGTLQQGASQDITVTATATNLAAGTYTGHVVVNDGPNTTHINVTFDVTNTPQPCLTVNTSQLSFTAKAQGSDPDAQGVAITNNCSAGNWSATIDQSWLSLSTTSGNIGANSNIPVNVQASIANMAAGTYTGHVTFYPGAVTVTVTLNIQQIPCISVQESPLNISVMQGNTSSDASGRVAISNGANCGSGTWTAQTDVSWITLNVSSGSLNAGAGTVVPFTVNESAVGIGSFTGHITFSPGSDSSVMTVNLTVYQRLCITANPTSLSFTARTGYAPVAQSFTVTNCGSAGTLSTSNITTSNGTNWLRATGGGSLPAGGSQTFTVTLSALSYSGNFTGQVDITMTGINGSTTSIQVAVSYYTYLT